MTALKGQASVRRRRTTRAVAGLSAALVLFGLTQSTAGSQEEEFIPGSGRADARIVRVGPSIEQLALSPTVGVALSDYQGGTLGRGQSIMIDWAALDGEIEDLAPDDLLSIIDPILATTSAPPECWDRSKYTNIDSIIGEEGGGLPGSIEQHVQAHPDAPEGAAQFVMPPITVEGLLEVGTSVAYTTSRILPGDIREATATTEIGKLSILDGLITIEGLKWESVHRSGAEDVVAGSFTFEGIDTEGLPADLGLNGLLGDLGVDVGSLLNEVLGGALGAVNDLLDELELGVTITWPELNTSGNIARMTPLRIALVNSPARQELFGPLFGELQPIRDSLIPTLVELGAAIDDLTGATEEGSVAEGDREVAFVGCPGDRQPEPEGEGGSPIPEVPIDLSVLVADIGLGLLSSASGVQLALGGTLAFTEGEAFDNPLAGGFDLTQPPEPVLQEIPGIPGTPGEPGVPGELPEETLAAEPSPAGEAIPGSRGGIAILIGLIGLALALALAGTDWYYIRRNRAVLAGG